MAAIVFDVGKSISNVINTSPAPQRIGLTLAGSMTTGSAKCDRCTQADAECVRSEERPLRIKLISGVREHGAVSTKNRRKSRFTYDQRHQWVDIVSPGRRSRLGCLIPVTPFFRKGYATTGIGITGLSVSGPRQLPHPLRWTPSHLPPAWITCIAPFYVYDEVAEASDNTVQFVSGNNVGLSDDTAEQYEGHTEQGHDAAPNPTFDHEEVVQDPPIEPFQALLSPNIHHADGNVPPSTPLPSPTYIRQVTAAALPASPSTPPDPTSVFSPAESSLSSLLYQPSSLFPLQNREEAFLLRYFMINLAPWVRQSYPAKHWTVPAHVI